MRVEKQRIAVRCRLPPVRCIPVNALVLKVAHLVQSPHGSRAREDFHLEETFVKIELGALNFVERRSVLHPIIAATYIIYKIVVLMQCGHAHQTWKDGNKLSVGQDQPRHRQAE